MNDSKFTHSEMTCECNDLVLILKPIMNGLMNYTHILSTSASQLQNVSAMHESFVHSTNGIIASPLLLCHVHSISEIITSPMRSCSMGLLNSLKFQWNDLNEITWPIRTHFVVVLPLYKMRCNCGKWKALHLHFQKSYKDFTCA
jgi:hypothetical protein